MSSLLNKVKLVILNHNQAGREEEPRTENEKILAVLIEGQYKYVAWTSIPFKGQKQYT